MDPLEPAERRTLIGLVALAVVVHVSLAAWYLLLSPDIAGSAMNRVVDNDMRPDLPIGRIASYTIGEHADFMRAPLFGLLEFFSFSAFGYSRPAIVLVVTTINALAGSTFIYLLVRGVLGSGMAAAVTLLNAIYFDQLIFPAFRTSYGNLNFVLIAGMLYLLLGFLKEGRSRRLFLVTAVLYGIALNMDSKLLLFPVLELLLVAVLFRGVRRIDLQRVVVCYVGFGVIMSPFLVRNYSYLGQLRPIQNNATIAVAAALAKFENPYFVNPDAPWILTAEEAARDGWVDSDSAQKALNPELRRRVGRIVRERPSLLVIHAAYNFTRIVTPWTLYDPRLKGRFFESGSGRSELLTGDGSLGGGSVTGGKVARYLRRDFEVAVRVGALFFRAGFGTVVFLIPQLLRYLFVLGALTLFISRRWKELLVIGLPVIYHASTLTPLAVNPDYLLGSYVTFLTLAIVGVSGLASVVRGRARGAAASP